MCVCVCVHLHIHMYVFIFKSVIRFHYSLFTLPICNLPSPVRTSDPAITGIAIAYILSRKYACSKWSSSTKGFNKKYEIVNMVLILLVLNCYQYYLIHFYTELASKFPFVTNVTSFNRNKKDHYQNYNPDCIVCEQHSGKYYHSITNCLIWTRCLLEKENAHLKYTSGWTLYSNVPSAHFFLMLFWMNSGSEWSVRILGW